MRLTQLAQQEIRAEFKTHEEAEVFAARLHHFSFNWISGPDPIPPYSITAVGNFPINLEETLCN